MIEKSRAPRKVAIADHLWDVFEQMAEEMGSDREGLVNQAMFMFARLNGYLTPGQKAEVPTEDAPPVLEREAPKAKPKAVEPKFEEEPEPPPDIEEEEEAEADDLDDDSSLDDDGPLDPVAPPIEDGDTPAGGGRNELGVASAAAGAAATAASPPKKDGVRRRKVEERVLETAAQLERQIKGKAERLPQPPVEDDVIDDELVDDDLVDDEEIDDDEIVDELMGDAKEEKSLYLMTADGELDKVAKERFLLGRGKHCDFVVQSGKVSREHAVISTESDGYYIEDLGSSNGTWYQKKRIKKRQIEDGDEFYICSEKIKCVIR